MGRYNLYPTFKKQKMSGLEKYTDFLFYQGNDGETKIQVILGNETVWVTQKSMAEIFDINKSGVSRHLKNIFEEGELDKDSVVAKNATTGNDGKTYMVEFYNLDAIISVGYRVNSQKATQFRIWASKILKAYLVKGYALDDERLKQGKTFFGKDYFDELLEKIREIRASERRFYSKITDIYKDCSLDYDPNAKITKDFYATVQNKLHWAITHHTAAELVYERANAKKPFMGLTHWKNQKKGGKIYKSDVSIAKNYLKKEEISELNRVVSMYLDFAENMARRRKGLKMKDWVERLDLFLDFNEYDILKDSGRISAKVAKKLAEKEYEKFRPIQDKNFKSDFDKVAGIISTTGELPKEESKEKQNLSDFNKKLKKGIDWDPKENM